MTRTTRVCIGAAILVVAGGGVVALSGDDDGTTTKASASANTEPVREGKLSAAIAASGTLTYRAQSDGSPFAAINHATGTYTELPDVGDKVGCTRVLYRVDDRPVLLLCGAIPAYRTLDVGDHGRDVRQLNRNLDLRGDVFTDATTNALSVLQRRRGAKVTGVLSLRGAVFLPHTARIAKVVAKLGTQARPGTAALTATSNTLHAQVNLDPSDQRRTKRGDRVTITLPGNTVASGEVDGFGRIAQATEDEQGVATIPAFIALDDPRKARGLDRAAVGVEIAIAGVDRALSVPVTALVGRPGGFAVERVRAGGRRDLVAVRLGLFDTSHGRVEVEGDLRAGDRVAVPSL